MKPYDSFLFSSSYLEFFREVISRWFLFPSWKEEQEEMMMATKTKKGESKSLDLIGWVFSWSIPDVMNKTLFKDKVGEIPQTFSSTDHYLQSFVYPLIEETHADLFSSMTTLSRAPVREVFDIKVSKKCKTSNDLLYSILFRGMKENGNEEEAYEPEFGDLFALTDVKPKCIDDLNRPKRPYTLALIQGSMETPFYFPILSSKPIEFKKNDKNGGKLYAVYLSNMTTNIRIWKALHPDQKAANMNIIKNILQIDSSAGEDCILCSTGRGEEGCASYARKAIDTFTSGLDHSQKSAVLKCIAAKECHHQHSVRLIWGPPGTGKTRTVASLLAALLLMKCRTLTCAPTNVAVLGVTNRLINLVRPTLLDTYGLGDIVLFGNGERMKIDDYEDLFDVFLDHRVSALAACLAPVYGWKGSVESMIKLLEDPERLHQLYLKEAKDDDIDEEDEKEEERLVNMKSCGGQDTLENVKSERTKSIERKALFEKVIAEAVKTNKKNSQEKKAAQKQKCSKKGKDFDDSKKTTVVWTFEEFVMKEFKRVGERLLFHLRSLYTHLPTCLIEVKVVKEIIRVRDMFQRLETLFRGVIAVNEGLRKAFYGFETEKHGKKHFNEVQIVRTECLGVLKHLLRKISLTKLTEDCSIRTFCLRSATLIFCTASSTAKLHTDDMTPLDLLIVDEAAQLKECESNIPLQLPGLRHAVLIGDEKQLPAMVRSKICEEADFGRSLFERLVIVGHKKHLLNVQYRMHPSISLFPNKQFYGRQIKDGLNVRAQSYQKRFLEGQIYGSYSFIDITYGKEQFDDKHSTKNLVEVHVIAEIIANLHKNSMASKQKLRVGCISPYKAQVFAIQEKLGKKYSTDADSEFSVNVRSVDGFQGGEEDVIIISTVRCNGKGSVGFLSNHQRTNVALTRARYCLWILGNSSTLINSGSNWKKLVLDSKARGCFYNASDDKNLVRAISSALVELRLFDKLLNFDSLLFKTARWKVHFSKEFMESISRNPNLEVYEEAISVLEKLARGWRHTQKDKILTKMSGTSSLPLEVYEVKDGWKLVWTIDIQRENAVDIQVMKVWGLLPSSKVPDLAKDFNKLFEDYTMNTITRCKCQHVEGNLVVPKKWPAGLHSVGRSVASDDPGGRLVSPFASMSLGNDEPRQFSRWNRNHHKKNNNGGRGRRSR